MPLACIMPPKRKIQGEIEIQKPSPTKNNNLNQVDNGQVDNTI